MSKVKVDIIVDDNGYKVFQFEIIASQPGYLENRKRIEKIIFPESDGKNKTLLGSLTEIPKEKPEHYVNTELIWLAQYHQWIAFNYISIPDAPYNNDRIDGPYFAPELPDATSDECRAAALNKDFARKKIDYYSPHQVCPKCRAII